MKFLNILLSLFLLSCTSNKQRELSDFIPQDKVEVVVEVNFDWKEQHFPSSCEWTELERIIDGDTIVVSDDVRVRFIGMDTPEIKHPNKPIQPFGVESSNQLEAFLPKDSKICLIADSMGDKLDKYDRQLAYIFTEEGLDVNAEMLKSGWAKGYFWFPFERKEEFRVYEKEAKEAQVNLWE